MGAISFSWINVTMCVTDSLSNAVSRRDFMQRYKVLQLSFHNFHNTIEVHLEEGWRLVMQSSRSCKTDLFLSITNLSFYSSKFDILHQSTTFKKLETVLIAKNEIQLSFRWLIWAESLFPICLNVLLSWLDLICLNAEPKGSTDLSGKKL